MTINAMGFCISSIVKGRGRQNAYRLVTPSRCIFKQYPCNTIITGLRCQMKRVSCSFSFKLKVIFECRQEAISQGPRLTGHFYRTNQIHWLTQLSLMNRDIRTRHRFQWSPTNTPGINHCSRGAATAYAIAPGICSGGCDKNLLSFKKE